MESICYNSDLITTVHYSALLGTKPFLLVFSKIGEKEIHPVVCFEHAGKCRCIDLDTDILADTKLRVFTDNFVYSHCINVKSDADWLEQRGLSLERLEEVLKG